MKCHIATHTVSPPHLKIPNQIFDLWLVESADAKPEDMEVQLHIYFQESM